MASIVVMEDDAGTRTLIASVLRKDGHDVLTADDGLQGLALVRPKPPDLIISDVQMPGMNGFDMLAALRKDPETAGVPVILLTSLLVMPMRMCARSNCAATAWRSSAARKGLVM